MPEAKRPRNTSRSSTSRSTSSRSAASGRSTTGRARGTGASKGGAKRPPAPRKPAARREELEPLDLEGTGFEELLDASATPRARRASTPEVADDDDVLFEQDEDDEEAAAPDPFASIRPGAAGRTDRAGAAASTSSFATAEPADPIMPLSERFGAGGGPDASQPIAPWSGLEEDPSIGEEEAKPLDELLVAILGLALAGVTALMPWYQVGFQKLSGLAAGKLGVLTFIGGFGAFLIAVLRRAKVKLRFPLQTGVMIEALAYLAVAGAIISRFIQPSGGSILNPGNFTAVGLGVTLAFVAARLTSGAPLMLQPGWMRGDGGRLGAVLLVLLILGAGALAVIKPGAPKAASTTGTGLEYTQDAPACLKDPKFPILRKVVAGPGAGYYSYEIPSQSGPVTYCGGNLVSDERIATLRKAYMSALKAAGWDAKLVSQGQPTAGLVEIQLSKPQCGAVRLIDTSGTPTSGGKTTVAVSLLPCAVAGGEPSQ